MIITDYAKLDVIVNDTSKFVEINTENRSTHSIIDKKRSITYYIRKYLKEFGKETVKNLIPSCSIPGELYRLNKNLQERQSSESYNCFNDWDTRV